MIEFVEIHKSDTIVNNKKTYDLEVDVDHTYNINGIIVHNSNCTTRKETGIGRSQLSAVIECCWPLPRQLLNVLKLLTL